MMTCDGGKGEGKARMYIDSYIIEYCVLLVYVTAKYYCSPIIRVICFRRL